MRRIWTIVLLANCATHSAIGQTTQSPALPALPAKPEEARLTYGVADRKHPLHDELQKQLAARDALTKEIERLRELIAEHEQVAVTITVSELSLTKLRESNITVEGVDTELLKRSGFRGVLSAGILDEPEIRNKFKHAEDSNLIVSNCAVDREVLLSELTTALREAGALKVLAQPTLTTISGKSVSFKSGGEFPTPVLQANGKSAIEYKFFGTQVDCVPEVLGNGRVRLDVRPHISELDSERSVVVGDVKVPGLRVRFLDTVVEMNLGQTAILAGLVQIRGLRKEGLVTSEPNGEELELFVTLRAEVIDVPKIAESNR